MLSTMMDVPLTVTGLMRYGTTVFGDSEVVTCTTDGVRRQSYAQTGARAAQLAGALRELGVDGDQRVATLLWNNAEHLEAYLAVPSMGAVLHTLNLRLDHKQLSYIANHAGDDVIITEPTLVPLLAAILPSLETVRHIVLTGPPSGEGSADAGGAGRARSRGALLRGTAGRPAGHVQLARSRRADRRRDVLHQRHHRPAEGRRIQPPVQLPARDGRLPGQRVRLERHRPGHAGGADVPRERLGAGLRGGAERRRPDHARPVPAPGAAGPADRGRAADDRRGGSDHLERGAPACPGPRRRRVLAAPGPLRGRCGPARADGGLPEGTRRVHPPGLGDDRDLAAGQPGPAAGRG